MPDHKAPPSYTDREKAHAEKIAARDRLFEARSAELKAKLQAETDDRDKHHAQAEADRVGTHERIEEAIISALYVKLDPALLAFVREGTRMTTRNIMPIWQDTAAEHKRLVGRELTGRPITLAMITAIYPNAMLFGNPDHWCGELAQPMLSAENRADAALKNGDGASALKALEDLESALALVEPTTRDAAHFASTSRRPERWNLMRKTDSRARVHAFDEGMARDRGRPIGGGPAAANGASIWSPT